MKGKNHIAEQIILMLREAGAKLAAGSTIEQICKDLGSGFGMACASTK